MNSIVLSICIQKHFIQIGLLYPAEILSVGKTIKCLSFMYGGLLVSIIYDETEKNSSNAWNVNRIYENKITLRILR